MAELSKNFAEQQAKIEKPDCFGKHEATSKADRLKCGMCWFSPQCKEIKPKKVDKQKDLIK